MGKQLSSEQKGVIEFLNKEGLSARAISKKIVCSHVTVLKLLNKIEVYGTSDRITGTSKAKKATEREHRILKRIPCANRRKSGKQVNSEFFEETGKKISNRTVSRRLDSFGLVARRPRKKPSLTSKMKAARLQFAKTHQNWTENDWKAVIFTDESKCNLNSSDGIQYVRGMRGEDLKRECVLTRNKFPLSFVIWGCILFFGQGELVFCTGSMNGNSYINVIRDHLVPSIDALFPVTIDPIFQDDSAPCHRAKKVSSFFSKTY